MSLLLLEFSSTACRVLERDLRGRFGRVAVIRDVETALASILDDAFDVLLLRWRGHVHASLCRVLRNVRPCLAIIAALGPQFREGYSAAFAAGVHDCVATPVNAAEVCARAGSILLRRDAWMRDDRPVEPGPRTSSTRGKPPSRDAGEGAGGRGENLDFEARTPSPASPATDEPDIDSPGSNSSRSVTPGPKATALGVDVMPSDVDSSQGQPLYFAEDLVVDLKAARVWVEGTEVRLTMRSWQLLVYLLGRRGRIVSMTELRREAFNETLDVSTLRDHVQRLRTTLGKAGTLIKTRRGRGYLLE